jgi:hypothetical protein
LWCLCLLSGGQVAAAQTGVPFTARGALAYGGGEWVANGVVNSLIFYPGDELEMLLEVGMRLPDGSVELDYEMGAVLLIKQVFTREGRQIPYDAREPWSPFTASGLALTNVQVPARPLQSVTTRDITIIDDQTLGFRLGFRAQIPDNLPEGYYNVVLAGFASVDDSQPFGWYQNRVFSTTGTLGEDYDSRLPLMLRIGNVSVPRAEWVLLGGQLPQDTTSRLFFSPVAVQPPGPVSLVPALVSTSFIPQFPSGVITAVIDSFGKERIPGTGFVAVENSASLPPATFISAELDGNLTRLLPSSADYTPSIVEYGFYRVRVTGSITDIFGNRYLGGGEYRLVIAEAASITPRLLPGMPLRVGDAWQPAVSVRPALPGGRVEVTMTHEPLVGEPVSFTTEGTLTAGEYQAAESYLFEAPGTYRILYRIHYLDAEGRMWYAEHSSTGVVAAQNTRLIARGRRGIAGYDRLPQAWFDTATYPFDASFEGANVNFPYRSGDIVLLPNSALFSLRPVLTAQDTQGAYGTLLAQRYASITNPEGDLSELIRRDSLPLVYPEAYAVLGITDGQRMVFSVAQGNADGPFTPLISGADRPVGEVLYLTGGILAAAPAPDAAGYVAAVEITSAATARVQPAADAFQYPVPWAGSAFVWPVNSSLSVDPRWMFPLAQAATGNLLLSVVAPDASHTWVELSEVPHSLTFDRPGVWRLRYYSPTLERKLAEQVVFVVTSEVPAPQVQQTVSRADRRQPVTLRAALPDNWQDAQAVIAVVGPRGVLLEDTGRVRGTQWSYSLNLAQLSRDSALFGADMLHVIVGFSAVVNGQPVFSTRQFTLQTAQVVSFE